MTENELDNWLPHRLPMRFIDELVEIDEEHAESRCDCKKADRLELFKDEDGIIPNVFLIEMKAQAIGVWAGYYRKDDMELSDVGFLLSVRGAELLVDKTPSNEVLTIKIQKIIQDKNLASFDGSVLSEKGETLAHGKITVYQPTKIEYDKLFSN